jgi:hypothetical protein
LIGGLTTGASLERKSPVAFLPSLSQVKDLIDDLIISIYITICNRLYPQIYPHILVFIVNKSIGYKTIHLGTSKIIPATLVVFAVSGATIPHADQDAPRACLDPLWLPWYSLCGRGAS